MICALLTAFRGVQDRYALQPHILPPARSKQAATSQQPLERCQDIYPLKSPTEGVLSGTEPSEAPHAAHGSIGLHLLARAQTGHLLPLRWHLSWPGGLQQEAH